MIPLRRIPLAWLMLTHKKGRLAISATGVAFASTLMFIEMGFLNGLLDTQTHIVDVLNGEVFLISSQKEAMLPLRPFPRKRLQQALGSPDVTAVYPLYIQGYSSAWRPPPEKLRRAMIVYGFNPDDPVFLLPEVAAHADDLKHPDTVLIDRESWPALLGETTAGGSGELGGHRVRVVGMFTLGVDMMSDGSLIVGDRTFFTCFTDPRAPSAVVDRVEVGLVKLRTGADAAKVRDELRRWLPDDVRVLTKAGFVDHLKSYWSTAQPVGPVFGMGMLVGFFIGVTICYQILYTDIMEHLPQYATLKAMGYSNRFLVGVTIQEAVYLGVLGFFPGLLVSVGGYAVLHQVSGMLMGLSLGRIVLVFVLTLLMCAVSGLLAIRRVLHADPAEVFA
ncbi:MAG TPA: ABC transporter permease DevC [Gemmataceae bacterium]|nr:ABC transporter permease DevC [Gemmataceae bacterium]